MEIDFDYFFYEIELPLPIELLESIVFSPLDNDDFPFEGSCELSVQYDGVSKSGLERLSRGNYRVKSLLTFNGKAKIVARFFRDRVSIGPEKITVRLFFKRGLPKKEEKEEKNSIRELTGRVDKLEKEQRKIVRWHIIPMRDQTRNMQEIIEKHINRTSDIDKIRSSLQRIGNILQELAVDEQ